MENKTDALNTLLEKRIATKHKLSSLLLNICAIKEGIASLELEIKKSFNDQLDTSNPKYSNAEKRKVELENEIKTSARMIKKLERLDMLETELAIVECDDTKEKLRERYMFKIIDLYITNKNNNGK